MIKLYALPMIVVEHITCLTVVSDWLVQSDDQWTSGLQDIDTLLPPFMHDLALLLCGPDSGQTFSLI